MKIINYPDNGKYVINDLNETSLTYKINTYEDLFLLKSIKDANPNLKEITIPCMFQQQHDRRFNQNESFELKLVCEFINSIGFEKVKVFHPHNKESIEMGLNNVEIIDNSKFIKEVLDKLHKDKHRHRDGTLLDTHFDEKISDYLTLMSSDAGGFKSLMKLTKQLNWKGETYSASKARSYENGESKLIQMVDRQDFGEKDILIVDDLCVYGGTFKGLSKLLKKRNCGKLYLAVSHITVQDLGIDPVTNYFDKVFCSNSKYDDYFVTDEFGIAPCTHKNLKIIKLF